MRADEVEMSWLLYDALLDADLPVHPYEAGTWGPDATNQLVPNGPPKQRTPEAMARS